MKLYSVELTEAATNDLLAIRDWIAREADIETACAFVDRIEARIVKLHYFPERGSPHPEVGDAIRTLSFERNHIIFYQVVGNIVEVVRVLHARRDRVSLA